MLWKGEKTSFKFWEKKISYKKERILWMLNSRSALKEEGGGT